MSSRKVYYVIESKDRGYLSNKYKDGDRFTWNMEDANFFCSIEFANREFRQVSINHNIDGLYYIHKVEMVIECHVKTFKAEISLNISEV